jgi:hypothetical protein
MKLGKETGLYELKFERKAGKVNFRKKAAAVATVQMQVLVMSAPTARANVTCDRQAVLAC